MQGPEGPTPYAFNLSFWSLLCNLGTDCIENTASSSFSVVPYISVAVSVEPLPSNGGLFWFHCSGFQLSCHNMQKYSANTEEFPGTKYTTLNAMVHIVTL
jgi:hypothetical protein